jgi:membrane protease YdiL (CAAX protease family)
VDPNSDPIDSTLDSQALSPVEPAPEAPSTLRSIFLGRFGLRAGWSLLIYCVLVVLAVTGIRYGQKAFIAHQHHAAAAKAAPAPTAKPQTSVAAGKLNSVANEPQPVTSMVIGEAILIGTLLLLSWIMAVIERRRLSAFGLGGQHFLHRFFHGAFWGLSAISLLVALLYAFHFLTFDKLLDHGLVILGWGAFQLLGFLLVGIFEEYFFRGYLQFTLFRGMVSIGNLISHRYARTIAFWIASFLTSALFLFAHTNNSGEDKLGLISVFLAGVVFVVALWRTGSLWWAIGFHMAWDWGQSFLYGVPNSGTMIQGKLFATHASGNPLLSGGTDGPEGSLLILVVLPLIILVLWHTHPSPQPPLETGR